MGIELPGLIIDLEARIDKFEKALKRANTTQAGSALAMERRAKKSADIMRDTYGRAGDGIAASFAKLAPSLAGGFAGAFSAAAVGGILRNISAVTKGIAEVGDAAKRSGLSAQAFQEWKFVAEQNRIGIDALTDGFKELSLRADEWVVTGGGAAAESFKRLGFGATELKEKLKDPSALMLEIIGRMQSLDKASQIRISDELFGGSGGEQFVQLLDQGEGGLRKTIARGHELGAVMDDELIARASDLDRKFGEISTRVASMFKQGIVDAATMVGLIREARDTMPYDSAVTGNVIGSDVSAQLDLKPQVSEPARAEIEGIAVEYDYLADAARNSVAAMNDASMMMGGIGNTGAAAALSELADRTETAVQQFEAGTITGAELQTKLTDIAGEANTTIIAMGELDAARLSGVTGSVGGLLDAIARVPALVAQAATAIRTMEGLKPPGIASHAARAEETTGAPAAPNSAPVTSPRPHTAPAMLGEPDLPKATGGGAGGGASARFADSVEKIREETAALEMQAAVLVATAAGGKQYGDALEFARTKAQLLADAQRNGIAMTPALTAQIDTLARSYVAAAESADVAADRLSQIKEQGRKGAQAVGSIFEAVATGAKTAQQALAELLIEILKAQLQKKIADMATGAGGGGTFFKILGGFLGVPFADGGYTGDGGRLEPAGVVHKGEFVVSKRATERIGVGNLEALHSVALKGYAGGGLVSGGGGIAKPLAGRSRDSGGAAPITINAPVTVNGSAGTPEQNADLARKVAREIDGTMRRTVVEELTRQMRPGGILGCVR